MTLQEISADDRSTDACFRLRAQGIYHTQNEIFPIECNRDDDILVEKQWADRTQVGRMVDLMNPPRRTAGWIDGKTNQRSVQAAPLQHCARGGEIDCALQEVAQEDLSFHSAMISLDRLLFKLDAHKTCQIVDQQRINDLVFLAMPYLQGRAATPCDFHCFRSTTAHRWFTRRGNQMTACQIQNFYVPTLTSAESCEPISKSVPSRSAEVYD